MTKLAIFDLDGTVLDSLDDLTNALNISIKEIGFGGTNKERVKRAIGAPMREFVRLSIGQEVDEIQLDKCIEKYVHYSKVLTCNIKPFNGITQVMEVLKKRGYVTVAFTNKDRQEMDSIMPIINDLAFDKVICSSDVPSKPSPDGIFSMMKEFNATAENTFMIGDGETDVLAGANAGVNSIAVLWGNRDRECLSKYGATVFANEPLELLEIMK